MVDAQPGVHIQLALLHGVAQVLAGVGCEVREVRALDLQGHVRIQVVPQGHGVTCDGDGREAPGAAAEGHLGGGVGAAGQAQVGAFQVAQHQGRVGLHRAVDEAEPAPGNGHLLDPQVRRGSGRGGHGRGGHRRGLGALLQAQGQGHVGAAVRLQHQPPLGLGPGHGLDGQGQGRGAQVQARQPQLLPAQEGLVLGRVAHLQLLHGEGALVGQTIGAAALEGKAQATLGAEAARGDA